MSDGITCSWRQNQINSRYFICTHAHSRTHLYIYIHIYMLVLLVIWLGSMVTLSAGQHVKCEQGWRAAVATRVSLLLLRAHYDFTTAFFPPHFAPCLIHSDIISCNLTPNCSFWKKKNLWGSISYHWGIKLPFQIKSWERELSSRMALNMSLCDISIKSYRKAAHTVELFGNFSTNASNYICYHDFHLYRFVQANKNFAILSLYARV